MKRRKGTGRHCTHAATPSGSWFTMHQNNYKNPFVYCFMFLSIKMIEIWEKEGKTFYMGKVRGIIWQYITKIR